MSKYNNKHVQQDGHNFDSKAEARRYSELKLRQMAGEIGGLVVHPRYPLLPGFERGGVKFRPVYYEADFEYTDFTTTPPRTVVEDVKGVETDVFKLKRKMFLYTYPHLVLDVVKA